MSRCSFSPTATFHTTAHTKSLLVTEMTSSSHPRFRFLIGWCFLMSSALLIMMVYLAIDQRSLPRESEKTEKQEQNSTETNAKPDPRIGFQHGPSFINYIRLIRDNEETWICSKKKMCESKSFSLKNATVELTINGLYYFHVQVYFKNIPQMQFEATVTLLKNRSPGKQERILSKVKRNGPGSLTMICLVELEDSMSISLDIDPINNLSRENYDTYWDIILFNNK